MTPAKTTQTPAQRRAALAKIHLGKKQLGLDDDTYRALLHHIAGVSSSKDLSSLGLDNVLAHLQKAGAVFTPPKKAGRAPHNLNSQASNAKQLKKIGALLADMALPWGYAEALAKRMARKDTLEFCSGQDLIGITAALVKLQAKKNVHIAAKAAPTPPR
jgi:phage gp16-like protein